MTGGGRVRSQHEGQMACTVPTERGHDGTEVIKVCISGFVTVSFYELVII